MIVSKINKIYAHVSYVKNRFSLSSKSNKKIRAGLSQKAYSRIKSIN